jgi:redox-sensitive bicupin YhaK (pirin superfamily)
LAAGSIQWMTAGQGIIHSEMPEQTDGLAWGYQLWVNLPAQLKRIDPQYQDIPKESLPVVEKDGARVKVLAGEFWGARSPAHTRIPFTYLDVRLEPDAEFAQEIPDNQNAFLYVIEGKVLAGPEEKPGDVHAGHLGIFGKSGCAQVMNSTGKPARFLLAAAQSLNEPIVRGGPFVMNTMGELKQAFLDYQTGKLV